MNDMDFGTILGLVLGVFCLVISVVIGEGELTSYLHLPSAFVTIGGGLCSTLINFRLKDLISVLKVTKKVFTDKASSANETIAMLVKLSEKTRREGLLSIEPELEQMEDPFIKQSLQLVVDGIESETIKDFMDTEIENMQARHGKGQAIFNMMGAIFPAWGMIGTLLGLINLLLKLDDPAQIGPSMSVALVTTFYGSILANFICIPIAGKLKMKSDEEVHQKEMIAEAVISIQAGENPKMLEQKLKIFLTPEERAQDIKEKEEEAADSTVSA
ncbi:MAG: motility protein A, partial [Acetivibrionales bacterium]|jgi:chemotaxis protein MotA